MDGCESGFSAEFFASNDYLLTTYYFTGSLFSLRREEPEEVAFSSEKRYRVFLHPKTVGSILG